LEPIALVNKVVQRPHQQDDVHAGVRMLETRGFAQLRFNTKCTRRLDVAMDGVDQAHRVSSLQQPVRVYARSPTYVEYLERARWQVTQQQLDRPLELEWTGQTPIIQTIQLSPGLVVVKDVTWYGGHDYIVNGPDIIRQPFAMCRWCRPETGCLHPR